MNLHQKRIPLIWMKKLLYTYYFHNFINTSWIINEFKSYHKKKKSLKIEIRINGGGKLSQFNIL